MPNNMQMKPKRKEPSGFPVAQIFAEVKRRLLDSCGERVMDFFAMLAAGARRDLRDDATPPS